LVLFSGLRKGDALMLLKSSVRDGRIWRKTGKTGQEVSIPLHPDLKRILDESPVHHAIPLVATANGTPWTVSGFNSSFIKAIARLEAAGKIESGVTFHGLRHTCGTLLVEPEVKLYKRSEFST
jgi:integrase